MAEKKNIVLAVLSGVLLAAAFPKIGQDWLVWIALVPLLYAVKDLTPGAFSLAFILAGSGYANLRVFAAGSQCGNFISIRRISGALYRLVFFCDNRCRSQTCRLPDNDTPGMGGPGVYPLIYIFRISLGVSGLLPV